MPEGTAGLEHLSLSKIWEKAGEGAIRSHGKGEQEPRHPAVRKSMLQVSVCQVLNTQVAPKNLSEATSLGQRQCRDLPLGTPERPLVGPPLCWAPHTSRISLILQPPLPMRDPHWLAGTTSRRVTGGRLAAVLLVMELLMSCEEEEVLRAQPCCNGTRWGRAWHRDSEVTLVPAAQAKVTSGLSQSHFPGLPQQPRKNTDVFRGSSSQTLLPQWKWV